ncbi:hypothetical protein RHS01_04128 [Rhizoctonia solani]|uniref:Uncharacterized protein n=1 Tax=Rhizoctonia solani TaxID=456999 RepID=A0A8H7M630_9AGAM|nr:hypothetical protein RHS01_04128 [Rhizoctonia solani]
MRTGTETKVAKDIKGAWHQALEFVIQKDIHILAEAMQRKWFRLETKFCRDEIYVWIPIPEHPEMKHVPIPTPPICR